MDRETAKGVAKGVVGGIVAAGLLAVWAVGYFKPVLQKENELSRIENQVLKFRAERQSQANELTRDSLMRSLASADSLRVVLEFELDSLRETYGARIMDLNLRLQSISQQYARLSGDLNLSEAQRAGYKLLADSTSAQLDSLRAAHEQLKRSAATQKRRGAWGRGAWGR